MLSVTIAMAPNAPEVVVRERLDRACDGTALSVGALVRSGESAWTAEIRAVDQRIVLGTTSYLEVLHRISRAAAVSSAAITTAERIAAA